MNRDFSTFSEPRAKETKCTEGSGKRKITGRQAIACMRWSAPEVAAGFQGWKVGSLLSTFQCWKRIMARKARKKVGKSFPGIGRKEKAASMAAFSFSEFSFGYGWKVKIDEIRS